MTRYALRDLGQLAIARQPTRCCSLDELHICMEAPMSEETNKHRSVDSTTDREVAVLAGGCFWGMQDLIRKLPGVVKTRVGYTGGDVPNATYRNHGSHAEAIEIEFDPTRISYRDLL